MLQPSNHLVVKVGQRDVYINRILGQGHVEGDVEGAVYTGSLLSSLPFLKQRGEGMHIELTPRCVVAQYQLTITL